MAVRIGDSRAYAYSQDAYVPKMTKSFFIYYDLEDKMGCSPFTSLSKENAWVINREKNVKSENVDEIRFNELAKKWKKETGGYSTTLQITRNKNYLSIVGMGDKALPFIFKEMQEEPNQWFEALYLITLAEPIKKESWGNIKKMTTDWLEWAKDNSWL